MIIYHIIICKIIKSFNELKNNIIIIKSPKYNEIIIELKYETTYQITLRRYSDPVKVIINIFYVL